MIWGYYYFWKHPYASTKYGTNKPQHKLKIYPPKKPNIAMETHHFFW